MMVKIKKIEYIHEGKKGHSDQYLYFCPACGYEHAFQLQNEGGYHTFNNDFFNPTIFPSLVQNFGGKICHHFVRDGFIQFCADCTHELAGKTVELPYIDNQ